MQSYWRAAWRGAESVMMADSVTTNGESAKVDDQAGAPVDNETGYKGDELQGR